MISTDNPGYPNRQSGENMALSDLLISGLELMLLGMGIVFFFLTILIFSLRGMSALADRFSAPEQTPQQPAITVTDGAASDASLIAAISAAIARYRGSHNA